MSFSQQPGWVAPPQPSMGDTINMLTSARNFQAQQAQAQAYAGAIDPVTGQFDQNKFNAALVGQGTRGTWGGGAAMQQAGQATSALGAGTQEQVKAQLAQLGTLNGVLTPLMQQAGPNGNIPVEKAQAALDQAHQAGLVNDAFYNQSRAVLGRVPPGGNVYSLLDSMRWTTQTAQAQLAGQTPGQEGVDVGSGRITVGSNPYMRGYQQPSGNYVPFGFQPGQQVTGVEIKMGDNSTQQLFPTSSNPAEFQQQINAFLAAHPGSVVAGSVVGAGGGGGGGGGGRGYVPYRPNAPAGGGGGGGPPAPAQPPPTGGGGGGGPAPARPAPAQPAPQQPPAPQGGGGAVAGPGAPSNLPVPPQPPASPPAATTSAPAAASPGPVSVGPPPAVVAGRSAGIGAEGSGTIGVTAAGGLTTASGGSPARQAALSDMASSLSGSNPLDTGVAADFVGKWSSAVNSMLPDALSSLVPGMTPQQLASLEGFHKLAEQLRQAQASQIAGTLTNDKFASALAASPNAMLSRLGNLGMIHILQGNEDAINAKNLAWQNDKANGWQDRDYLTWQTRYNQLPQADPRVYWLQHMSPEERTKFVGGITDPREKASLAQHYEAVAP